MRKYVYGPTDIKSKQMVYKISPMEYLDRKIM